MQIPLVTMKKLLMRLIRANVVVLLTTTVVSIRWVYQDLAQGAPQEDDVFGRPKFTIPKFLGKEAEEYLNSEVCIDPLWCLHECMDDRKIRLGISEFDEYAMSWWDNVVSLRRDNNMVPILTWRDMKVEMRHSFVPPNYTWSLYDKLTNLIQGIKPVDEYYQEMELIMQHVRVRKPAEQTMQ
jgi:hypothetical protein